MMASNVVYSTDFPTLHLWRRGKVRDVYDLGTALLIVATDRISAYDVVMNDPIPGKGALLTAMSLWWFGQLADIVPNHLISADAGQYPESCAPYRDVLQGRSMLVQKTRPLPVECVARGYLAGSGWKEYTAGGTVCGIRLKPGLRQSERLDQPIFTPATKAEQGHDENIAFDRAVQILGAETAERVRGYTLLLYERAWQIAAERGIIIADTKFEFGYDPAGQLILIDEILTPDSSRFWLAESYKPGMPQENFDKQFLRDYLESVPWDKNPPPPPLPPQVIEGTARKYSQALQMLTGR